MTTLAQGFKKGTRKSGPDQYFYEEERRDLREWMSKSLYNSANRLEEVTKFELEAFDATEKLNHIINEIVVRTRITKQEIFKIGELLLKAKKICHSE